jgi:hypothetical protein
VESSCELGNEPSGSIKCWELPSGCTSCGLSSGTQLHRVSYVLIVNAEFVIFLQLIIEDAGCTEVRNNVACHYTNSVELSTAREATSCAATR